MKNEDMIKFLREIIHCYDVMNNGENPRNKEISMWRLRFLNFLNIPKEVREMFLYAPSEDLMKTSPEKYVKDLLGILKEKDE